MSTVTVADVAVVRHVVQRILVPCVFVIGLLGNSVSIYVLTRKRMRCTTNIYLTALAITDIIYLTMALLLSLKHYDYVQRHCEPYWMFYGMLVWLCDACAYISIYIAVCFTIERFIAIRYPLKRQTFCTESLAKKVIAGVALFCVLSTISTAFEHEYVMRAKLIDGNGEPCNVTLANDATAPAAGHINVTVHAGRAVSVPAPAPATTTTVATSLNSPLQRLSAAPVVAATTTTTTSHDAVDDAYQHQDSLWQTAGSGGGDGIGGAIGPLHLIARFQQQHEQQRSTREVSDASAHQTGAINSSSSSSSSFSATTIDVGEQRSNNNNNNGGQQQLKANNIPSLDFATLTLEHTIDLLLDAQMLEHIAHTADMGVDTQDGGDVLVPAEVAAYEDILHRMHKQQQTRQLERPELQHSSEQQQPKVAQPTTHDDGSTITSFNITFYCENITYYQHEYSDLAMNVLYMNIWYPFTSFVFVLIPLCVLATFNCFLIMLVRRSKSLRGKMTNANSIRRPRQRKSASSVSQENRVTVTLIAVVLLFIICQLPWAIYLIVSEQIDIDENLRTIYGNVFNFLAAINAAANFFLYCVLSDKYRKTVRELITGYKYRTQSTMPRASASLYTQTPHSAAGIGGSSMLNGSRRYRAAPPTSTASSASMVIK